MKLFIIITSLFLGVYFIFFHNTSSYVSSEIPLDKQLSGDEKEAVGVYTRYTGTMLGKREYTVLFFYELGCQGCEAADYEFSSQPLPAHLTILKVDFDNHGGLKDKHRVKSPYSFVQVDESGDTIHRWVGGGGIDNIIQQLQKK